MRYVRGRRARRYRQDRKAHQVVLMLTMAMFLLALGGMWWLVSPTQAGGSAGGRVEPLTVLETTDRESDVLAIPSPRKAVEPSVAAEVEAEPATIQTKPVPAVRAVPTFNGRPIRKVKTIRMLVTAYSPDERSCGVWAKYKTTASGYSVWTNAMRLVAADPSILRYGSIVSVPGYDEGSPVPVLDCGGAIKGQRLDVLFPTHEAARKWGKKWIDVTVWRYVD